jgi:hypothetical protein
MQQSPSGRQQRVQQSGSDAGLAHTTSGRSLGLVGLLLLLLLALVAACCLRLS